MLRIIAGEKKGLTIEVPSSAKPITDRIKTSIFDLIRDFIEGAEVLDLFSGSGNFAIEALSRGANRAVIVEIDDRAVEIIKKNIIKAKYNLKTDIFKMDAVKYLKKMDAKFDLIMLDPPFPMSPSIKNEVMIMSTKLLKPNGLLIFRFPQNEKYDQVAPDVDIVFKKDYGISQINYILKKQI